MKLCTKCSEIRPFEYFGKHSRSKDGYQCWCKDCRSLYQKNNAAKRQLLNKNNHLLRKYGKSLVEVQNLLEDQNGLCAVCSKDISSDHHVDHNHETGTIRGLLCGSCNRALGLFKDSPNVLNNAYQYLIERGHYG